MAIATLATEAKATALITACRDALSRGGAIRGQNLKDVIDQLESVTVNNVTARTDVTPDTKRDGRDTAEKATEDA